MRDHEYKTVTLDVTCTPYLAIWMLFQLDTAVQYQYPPASTILRNIMYVEDVLASAHAIATALWVQQQLISTLQSAGLSLRKWTSKSKQILDNLNG